MIDPDDVEELAEDPKEQSNTLLVFMFSNNSINDARITISFDQRARNNVNFRMPVTDFTAVAEGRKTSLPLKFTKVRPGLNWGNLDCFRIAVDGTDMVTGAKTNKFERDYMHMRAQKLPLIAAAEAEMEMNAPQQLD